MGTLRTKRAFALLLGAAILFALVVISRWPGNATVELSGAQAHEVFRLFAYGVPTILLLLVPAFPAASIVRERKRGTLTLLLNSPMSAWSIFLGKVTGLFIFVALLLIMSIPAAAAAYAMGGISLSDHLIPFYVILVLILLEYTTLALLVSSYTNSVDAALRITYALVLIMVAGTLIPHFLQHGKIGILPILAELLRNVSPVPPLMDLAGDEAIGPFALISNVNTMPRFVMFTVGLIAIFSALTVRRLHSFMLDRPRPQGVVTDQRSSGERVLRRIFFLVDPNRRKKGISFFMNPVMVKEFRTRRFGRSHWLLRFIAISAMFSLYLTYAATVGTIDWGVETIGGIMVVLQVILIVVIAPSLAANLISGERESGGWDLLRMTPLSAPRIILGKLASVFATLSLALFATVPGYLVMIWIHPASRWQIWQVLICLAWLMVFAVFVSAAISSLTRRVALATTVSYAVLGAVCIGTMLFWLGRGVTFGNATVEAILKINPMAAALNIIEAPGFAQYNLIPDNWWWMGVSSAICAVILLVQTWRLTRPQ